MGNKNLIKRISKIVLIQLSFLFLLFGCSTVRDNTAIVPTNKLQSNWWKERHQKVLEQNKNKPQLILIGNSILHTLDYEDRKHVHKKYLDKYNTVNMGFSGDRTENVIWRLQNGEIDNIRPKVALLLIGTNNTDGNNYPTINYPSELKEATWKICEIIREKLPNTQILLLGILPFGRNIPNYRNNINKKTNEYLENFSNKDSKIHYLDIGDIFLDKDGKIIKHLMPDYLHPNAEGHMVMFKSLENEISKLID